MSALFQIGDFILRSGQKSNFRIECDALTRGDWEALALMSSGLLPPFRFVLGVPTGGLPFAAELNRYATHNEGDPILVAEDVWTTGGSMVEFCKKVLKPDIRIIGVCAFARGTDLPSWVIPLFRLADKFTTRINSVLTHGGCDGVLGQV